MAVSAALAVTTVKTHTHQCFLAKRSSYEPTSSSSCSLSSKTNNDAKLSLASNFVNKKCVLDVGVGILAASIVCFSPMDANATRIEYYATVADPPCDLSFVSSGLGFCDVSSGSGQEAPYGELINVSSYYFRIFFILFFKWHILIFVQFSLLVLKYCSLVLLNWLHFKSSEEFENPRCLFLFFFFLWFGGLGW